MRWVAGGLSFLEDQLTLRRRVSATRVPAALAVTRRTDPSAYASEYRYAVGRDREKRIYTTNKQTFAQTFPAAHAAHVIKPAYFYSKRI